MTADIELYKRCHYLLTLLPLLSSLNLTFDPREALRETMSSDELRERDQWTLFGNEAEKLEIGMIKNQRVIRERVDRWSLRTEVRPNKLCPFALDFSCLHSVLDLCVHSQAQKKASVHMKFIEDLSLKSPDFSVPLRPHTVWTGMEVKLSCSVQGCPTPSVTW